MTKSSTCIDSASHNFTQERMFSYKRLAEVFSYPKEEKLQLEYDRIFRSSETWPYLAEYLAENEFQRQEILADISGFYKAFALETASDRPDALTAALEFMHYLIFKEIRAPSADKAWVCLEAQKKFFHTYLFTAGVKLANRIMEQAENKFYKEKAKELAKFLQEEAKELR